MEQVLVFSITAMGNPSLADTLRRELRRRGIAAFGLVEAAA